MNNSFSLIALDLRQQPSGHILKTLKNQVYFFDKRYDVVNGRIMRAHDDEVDTVVDKLYGDSIRIHAIVGKNGAGKSSLLDIIYRIINNLSFTLQTSAQSQWTPLYLINDIYACLYYLLDDKTYCITCSNQLVFWEEVDLVGENDNDLLFQSTWNRDQFDYNDLIRRSKELFYVIVTNYSPQSLVSDEYVVEKVSNYYKGMLHEREETSWMPSLFHKNDGYLTPICLAPFREDNGAINMTKELRLATYRLSSIFLYYVYAGRNTNAVIDSYSLSDIQYEYSPKHVYEKFSKYNDSSKKSLLHVGQNTIGKRILSLFGVPGDALITKDNVYQTGCEYLVAKVYSIVDTYESYSRYKKIFFRRNKSTGFYELERGITEPLVDEELVTLLGRLVDKLQSDHSHITIKLRQVLYMLRYIRKCAQNSEDCSWLSEVLNKFSYRTYFSKVHENHSVTSIEELQALLPPPIFNIEIRLYKDEMDNGGDVSFMDMSSGEKQMLCVLSTIVYHVLNLISIAQEKDRVSYSNVLLMLDEVEICFHPDYQRQFINRLINMLNDLQLTFDCTFYILLATHSPFMLSDIPQRNILYLEHGEDKSDDITVNPFCANVNDILYQSFFMENGFSGEFAIRKVKEIMALRHLEANDNHYVQKIHEAQILINKIIGDPILQNALREMLSMQKPLL